MLVLNFMYMKKNLFRFSSRRILFSTVIASALLASGSQTVFADAGEVQAVLQAGAIKGKIVDSNGEPVIGANVKVKGTTNGTITDIDGNFALNNVSGGTLTISFIGYKTLEIPVKGTNLARIVMHEDTEVLDEVVVVGYGTMKKESLTGSVAVVDRKYLKDKGTVATHSRQCRDKYLVFASPVLQLLREKKDGMYPFVVLFQRILPSHL